MPARRVQLGRVVVVVYVVGRDDGLDGPFEQLRVIDDRAVHRRQRAGEALAVGDEEDRLDRVHPDVGVMDERRREQRRHAQREAKALGDQPGLEVRIGQATVGGGC